MNKKLLFSLIFILAVYFIIIGCLKKPTDQQQPVQQDKSAETNTNQELTLNNKPTILLNNLKTLTKINFSDIQDKEFEWMVELAGKIKKLTVTGKSFQAAKVTSRQQSLLMPFLATAGFEMDPYNLAADTVAGLTGYKKDNLVCLVQGQAGLDDQGLPVEGKEVNMTVSCGEIDLSLNQVLEMPKQETITKLFADKYNKKISAIKLTIQQETGSHARGLVKFEDEPEPGNAGMFLAAKVDGNWQLLFDGNGAFACQDMQPYGFPQSMLEGCF